MKTEINRVELKCDYCERVESFDKPEDESLVMLTWLTLDKPSSTAGDRVDAGEYHFCRDKCLKDFLTK